jgi:hypothetical protein
LSTLEVSDEIRAALSEGQTAYREVGKLRNKNTEIIGEKKAFADKYSAVEEKLKLKGLSIEDLDNFDPNAGSEENLKRFQQQLESERATFNATNSELALKLENAIREQSSLSEQIQQSKIRDRYNSAAKTAGVDSDFTDDYYSILQARGVQMYQDSETGEIRGKRPNDVVDYTLETLLTNFKADPTHQRYFAGKFGGGSGTNPGSGKTGSSNPFHADSFNLYEQGQLFKKDPVRAAELQRLADS